MFEFSGKVVYKGIAMGLVLVLKNGEYHVNEFLRSRAYLKSPKLS